MAAIDIAGLVAWLYTLEARGWYSIAWVADKIDSFGVPVEDLSTWLFEYEDGAEVSGMFISMELVGALNAPPPGSYGGWGFQHSANVRAIEKLAKVSA